MLVWEEIYENGDYCDGIKVYRNVKVKYFCSESFFEIIKIDEPTICGYALYVGTNLLCGK